jgi:peptide-methionine (S)-S-oxide reductase
VFYRAEEYHQEYFARNPDQGYCQIVIAPKVAKFRQKYANRMKV